MVEICVSVQINTLSVRWFCIVASVCKNVN
jgi:hypothetical protein